MTPATSEMRPPEDLSNPSSPAEKLEQLVVFQCANGACELEFPIFADSMHVVYCPRCSGIVVKKTGIMCITLLR